MDMEKMRHMHEEEVNGILSITGNIAKERNELKQELQEYREQQRILPEGYCCVELPSIPALVILHPKGIEVILEVMRKGCLWEKTEGEHGTVE